MAMAHSFDPPPHPSLYHYKQRKCRCNDCRRINADSRMAIKMRSRPEGWVQKRGFPPGRRLPRWELEALRREVGYDPNKDYDLMEANSL